MNKLFLVLTLILAFQSAFATNGYFMIGYGAKTIGLGGAGVAFGEDRLVGAMNPAGMALVSDGYDFGARSIAAIRNGSIDCRGIGACDMVVKDRASRDFYVIPNFGWRRGLGDALAIGVTVYGNGGINTTYGRAFYDEAGARIFGANQTTPGFPRTGKLGVDFSQLFIATSVAYQISPNHAIGIAPIMSIQRFSTRGLETFAGLSSDPSSVTGRGTNYELGGGFRVGWVGELLPRLSAGAQYTSRIWTGAATKYNGLLADGGQFDAPPHWSVGLAWRATDKLVVLADYQEILFGSVDALSNPGPTAAELAGVITPERRLGASNGIGFGWTDQSVFKLGVRFAATDKLTLRAGWNHGSSQIPNRESLINIIAPATINDNAAIGGSWRFGAIGELSVTFMHAFKKANHDRSTNFFGTAVRTSIYEHALDIAWSKDFR